MQKIISRIVWSATLATTLTMSVLAGEHPRLLVDKTTVAELRQRCQQQPYAAMVARIQTQLDAADTTGSAPVLYDDRLLNNAALHLVTGQKKFAEAAEKLALACVNDTAFWNNPGSKGLTRAGGVLRVAMAYDACSDAWTEANRTLVSQKLLSAADNLMKSMGAGANTQLANNWQAVRYAGAGLAYLACDELGTAEKAKAAYDLLKKHLVANLGDNGWNPEGIGYTQYPWQYSGPFSIAAARAGLGDLRKEVPKAPRTFWTIYAGTVAIPYPNGCGIRADLGDDHPSWGGSGVGGLAFYFATPEQLPGLRWMYDYLAGERGGKSFDSGSGGGLYSVLYYPVDVPPKNPAQVPTQGLNYTDKSHGIAMYRNRYEDENDIVFLVNGHSRQPAGCHGGPDTDTYRLIGLGSAWIVGSGRTGDANGQSNLFPGTPSAKPPGGLGKLVSADFLADGGGTAIATGSCMGTLNQKRVAGVDFSGTSGSPGVVVMAETSDNGAIWRLNTPEFNTLTTDGNTFTLTAPNGATLVATVVEPAQVKFNTGTFQRGGGAGHAGFQYRDKKYINNTWIEFACDKNVLVIFTLQPKGKTAPRVTGTGTAVKADLKIGTQTVAVAGDKVTFAR